MTHCFRLLDGTRRYIVGYVSTSDHNSLVGSHRS